MQAGLIYYTIATILVGVITWFIVDSDDKIKVDNADKVNKHVWRGSKMLLKALTCGWLLSVSSLSIPPIAA